MGFFGNAFRLPFRIIVGILIAIGSLISYFSLKQENPVTGETQRIKISTEQEVALGLQAAPEMAQQFGGLIQDEQISAGVQSLGEQLVRNSDAAKSDYQFNFHVLADPNTINAFALPGGQIFITAGMLKLLRTKGELAGVLAHEVGHVIGRHSAEQIAKQELTQGLTGAAVIASYDPENPSTMRTAAVAALIGNLVNMKFGRDDELESDKWGVRLMAQSGYDPNAMVGVMEILRDNAGGSRQPEFFSTHPNPENRIAKIQEAINKEFPNGLPSGLEK